MIRMDASKTLKSLRDFHKEAVRKLEGMVEVFTYQITVEAIDNTPYGELTPDNQWMYELDSRMKKFLAPEPGHAKGGWNIQFNKFVSIRSGMRATDSNAYNIKQYADDDSTKYRLGQTVIISNSVPYVANKGFTLPKFGSLEEGYSDQAPNGIMQPTLDQIMSVYNKDLSRYYKGA